LNQADRRQVQAKPNQAKPSQAMPFFPYVWPDSAKLGISGAALERVITCFGIRCRF